jgi:hypothetical protein
VKTRLFYAIAAEQSFAQQFISDLRILLRGGSKLRKVCLGAASELEAAMTRTQERKLAEEIASKHGFGIVQVVSVLQAIRFLIEQLAKDVYSQDRSLDMAADLEECGRPFKVMFKAKDRRIFQETIGIIREGLLPAYKERERRRAAAAGVLPSLKSFGTTAELRAVVGTPFRVGMSADKYEPDVKGVVAVVSVNIGVDSGSPDEFSFQASPEEIQALIEELRSALVCVHHLKPYTHRSASVPAQRRKGQPGGRG